MKTLIELAKEEDIKNELNPSKYEYKIEKALSGTKVVAYEIGTQASHIALFVKG